MKYTDALASKLQNEFNIPEATVKGWKFKKRIPDKYMGETKFLYEYVSKEWLERYLYKYPTWIQEQTKAHIHKAVVVKDRTKNYYKQMVRSYVRKLLLKKRTPLNKEAL